MSAPRWFLASLVLFGLALGTPARAQESDDSEKPAAKPDDQPKRDEKAPPSPFATQIVDFLKKELDLTQDQIGKVTVIMEDALKDAMKLMVKRMGEEEPDPEQGRRDQEEMREKIVSRIREVLDEPQKKELESLLKDFENRQGRFERAQDQPGGDAALWFEGEHPSRTSLLAHAEAALILSQDEHQAIFPLIEKVVDARIALREFDRGRRKDLARAVHSGAKNDEVQERFHEIRRRGAALRDALEKAEANLREVVTIDQEARLVAIGVLD
jgi:hypothetical protein